MKEKIDLYTLVYNEMDILPFCVDYWKRFAEHVYVFDNGSDEGSVEYLTQFPWITVQHFDSEGLDDAIQVQLKNTVWKESRGQADWVVVCDCDELLYGNHLEEELLYMRLNGYTAMGNRWYSFFGDHKPEYEEGKLLHELVKTGAPQSINYDDASIGKIMLFNPNVIEDMHYEVGCHRCHPEGRYKMFKSPKTYVFHIDKGLGIDYKLDAFKKRAARLSERNKMFGWGIHYNFPEEQLRKAYNEGIANSIDLTTLK